LLDDKKVSAKEKTTEFGGPTYHGQGINTDIILASSTAYINAINMLLSEEGQETVTCAVGRHSVADERKVDI